MFVQMIIFPPYYDYLYAGVEKDERKRTFQHLYISFLQFPRFQNRNLHRSFNLSLIYIQ